MQKNCTYNQTAATGWKVTLAGPSFSNRAEKNYADIDGEFHNIAWLLDQTKYINKGCKDCVVVTNHKALIKIFGDRALNKIQKQKYFQP